MDSSLTAGQVIGSRYRLNDKNADQLPYAGASIWRAVDTSLRLSVRILILERDDELCSEVLDSARRASLFHDVHTVKILRVDSDSHYGWIVTEIPLGTSLAYRLYGTPFAPEQAKAIVGETARIIAAASAQGVRHLTITPADIYVDEQGQVFLDGLAIHAALAGMRTDTDMPHELNRKEADCLTRLYAQLLSGDGETDADILIKNLSEDETLDSDLSYFFEKSLRGAGALSPSDFIRNLGSWGAVAAEQLPPLDGEVAEIEEVEKAGIQHEEQLSSDNIHEVNPQEEGEEDATVDTEEETDDTAFESDNDATSVTQEASGAEETSDGDGSATQAPGEHPSEELAGNASDTGENASNTPLAGTQKPLPAEQAGTKAGKANLLSSIAAKTGHTGKVFSEKTASSFAAVASSKPVRDAVTSFERHIDKVSDVPEEGGERRFDTSWLFIAFSIGIVVLAGLWAFSLFFSTPKVHVVEQGPVGPAIIGEDTATDTHNDAGEPHPLIKSVELLNPQAGNLATSSEKVQDNPDTVANIADGKTSTVWSSWWYPTSHYTAGKDGIGLRINLKEPTLIENVYLQVNGTGGTVQWLAGEPGEKAEVLAEAPMSTATHLISLKPVETDTVTLWISELPTDKAKKNRVVIAEVDFNRQISDAVRDSAQSD
ncbi:MAG: hypothetical protein IKZ87_06735 [Actinomycetaceae bacterium]|nr:hypothetical protein [Actinomycetaceae bacterium]